MTENWDKEIRIAELVNQKLHALDTFDIWGGEYPPEVAATEEILLSTEETLGYRLDSQYRAFLSRANGWRGFYQHVDIFGTSELVSGLGFDKAKSLGQTLEPIEELCGVPLSGLTPIGISKTDLDVFFVEKSVTNSYGKVFWFAGNLIETFPSFLEFFLSMIDYNRKEVESMKRENQ